MWIVSFAFYIIGLTRPLVGNVGLIIGLLSVVTAGFLIRKFRGEVFPLRFGQSWWMATLIFLFSCVIYFFSKKKSRFHGTFFIIFYFLIQIYNYSVPFAKW